MKTKEKNKRSLLEQLRKIRDKISYDIQDMSFEELNKYLKNKKSLHPSASKERAD